MEGTEDGFRDTRNTDEPVNNERPINSTDTSTVTTDFIEIVGDTDETGTGSSYNTGTTTGSNTGTGTSTGSGDYTGTTTGSDTGTGTRRRGRPAGSRNNTAGTKTEKPRYVNLNAKDKSSIVSTEIISSIIMVTSAYLANSQPLIPEEFNITPNTALKSIFLFNETESKELAQHVSQIMPALPEKVNNIIAQYVPALNALVNITAIMIPRITAYNEITKRIKQFTIFRSDNNGTVKTSTSNNSTIYSAIPETNFG